MTLSKGTKITTLNKGIRITTLNRRITGIKIMAKMATTSNRSKGSQFIHSNPIID